MIDSCMIIPSLYDEMNRPRAYAYDFDVIVILLRSMTYIDVTHRACARDPCDFLTRH